MDCRVSLKILGRLPRTLATIFGATQPGASVQSEAMSDQTAPPAPPIPNVGEFCVVRYVNPRANPCQVIFEWNGVYLACNLVDVRFATGGSVADTGGSSFDRTTEGAGPTQQD